MTQQRSISGLLSIPALCLGLCLIAVCVLVPQAEANRRTAVDRDQLRQDLGHADAQIDVNARFLAAATTDPEVAERLAQRQMRQIRQGSAALHLEGESPALPAVLTVADMLRVPTPPPVPAYRPMPGYLSILTDTTRHQLCGLGCGLFLVAVGLVLGTSDPAVEPDQTARPAAV